MVESYKNNGRVFSCGNGGSMCDAMHFAEELTGRFRKERAPLAAMAISDSSHLSCVANDYGYDFVFSRYVEAWGQQGDVLLAISTSGNSKNVILAVEAAKKKGMKVVGLLGKGGGILKDMVDVPLVVDSSISDRIQEIHIKCIHIFIEGIERNLFPKNYN
jgi:D-sedoheptulose 7-phosphate isomerase